jgi:hypothetical protein
MDMDMQLGWDMQILNGNAALPWTCSMEMDMKHGIARYYRYDKRQAYAVLVRPRVRTSSLRR